MLVPGGAAAQSGEIGVRGAGGDRQEGGGREIGKYTCFMPESKERREG